MAAERLERAADRADRDRAPREPHRLALGAQRPLGRARVCREAADRDPALEPPYHREPDPGGNPGALVPEGVERLGECVAALAAGEPAQLDARRVYRLDVPALAHGDDDRLARAAVEIEDRATEPDLDLAALELAAVADQHAVVAGRDRDPDRRTARLVGLGDHRARAAILDHGLALERARQLERRRRGARERQRHIAVALEVDFEADVLAADRGLRGRQQRLVVGVAVGLVDRDLAVVIGIARAAQPDEQVVREVRRAQLLALLRQLAAAR